MERGLLGKYFKGPCFHSQEHKWKLLGSLSKLDIRVKQWTKYKWNADYLESTSRVRAFIPRVSSRQLGMSLPRTSWVRLNRLWTGVGRFYSSMYKWVSLHHRITNMAPQSKPQITLYLYVSYIMYQEEHEVCRFWMTHLNAGLTPLLLALIWAAQHPGVVK